MKKKLSKPMECFIHARGGGGLSCLDPQGKKLLFGLGNEKNSLLRKKNHSPPPPLTEVHVYRMVHPLLRYISVITVSVGGGHGMMHFLIIASWHDAEHSGKVCRPKWNITRAFKYTFNNPTWDRDLRKVW